MASLKVDIYGWHWRCQVSHIVSLTRIYVSDLVCPFLQIVICIDLKLSSINGLEKF